MVCCMLIYYLSCLYMASARVVVVLRKQRGIPLETEVRPMKYISELGAISKYISYGRKELDQVRINLCIQSSKRSMC